MGKRCCRQGKRVNVGELEEGEELCSGERMKNIMVQKKKRR